jgi:hypothetical protein
MQHLEILGSAFSVSRLLRTPCAQLGSAFSVSVCYVPRVRSRDVAVAATGCVVRGSITGRGKRFVSAAERPDLFWGPTQPAVQWLPGVPSLGREADHSPPTIAEVRTSGAVTLHPITPSCSVQGQLYVYLCL